MPHALIALKRRVSRGVFHCLGSTPLELFGRLSCPYHSTLLCFSLLQRHSPRFVVPEASQFRGLFSSDEALNCSRTSPPLSRPTSLGASSSSKMFVFKRGQFDPVLPRFLLSFIRGIWMLMLRVGPPFATRSSDDTLLLPDANRLIVDQMDEKNVYSSTRSLLVFPGCAMGSILNTSILLPLPRRSSLAFTRASQRLNWTIW